MTIKFVSILLFLLMSNLTNLKNDIIGKWQNNKAGYTIEIFNRDNRFFGKIIDVKETKSNDEIGHVLLTNLVFDASYKKYYGKVKTPSGMTADCEIELLNQNQFQLTVKKLFIKKTQMFKRTE